MDGINKNILAYSIIFGIVIPIFTFFITLVSVYSYITMTVEPYCSTNEFVWIPAYDWQILNLSFQYPQLLIVPIVSVIITISIIIMLGKFVNW